MAIKNYTTSVPAEKTMGEIQAILRKHGATKIVMDYLIVNDREETCITFNLPAPIGPPIYFSLRANWEGVLNRLVENKKVPNSKCTPEHAMNVAWRIQKDWLDAQLAIVESGLQTMDEAFFSKAITQNGTTAYEELVKNSDGRKLLSTTGV